jgi:zinc protease
VNRILGESACSRLFVKVREEKGLVYDISSSLYSLSNCGILEIRVTCSPENTLPVLRIIEEEIKEFSLHGATLEEFSATKKILTNAVCFAQSSLATLNDFYGLWKLLGKGKRKMLWQEEEERIKNVSLKKIQTMASFIFKPQNFRFVAMGPLSGKLQNQLKEKLDGFLK